MQKLVNREMMQAIDQKTMNDYQMPSMVLMERAALKVYEEIKSYIDSEKADQKVLIVCGVGNNGGDGVAIARMLHLSGIFVEIQIVGNLMKETTQMKAQLEIVKKLEVPIKEDVSYNSYSIIVDAIFGVGLKRAITGKFEQVIQAINQSEAYVFSVDLPSGINADDGSIMNVCVKADQTITFGYQKIGLIRYPGNEYAGKVIVADAGFPQRAYEEVLEENSNFYECFTYTREDLKRIPKRKKQSHKGTFGTVLVIAGSEGMSGACYLSAKAALRMGAGLVKIMTVKSNRIILQTLLPEAVVMTYDMKELKENESYYINAIETASSIVIGPGLGTSEEARRILNLVLKTTKVPTVIDADALNLISNWMNQELVQEKNEVENIQRRVEMLGKILPKNALITPHMKELSRLTQTSIHKIYEKFIDMLDIYSYNMFLIYILKDTTSVVSNGRLRYFNTSGNDALATGGSGDVLTGIIGGLLAQGINPYEAACLGVYIHGLTAEYYTKQTYSGSMIAGDIVECIGKVMK